MYRLLNDTHDNIVSFFGFVADIVEGIGLVTSYFSRGNVTLYLQSHPSADRNSLVSHIWLPHVEGMIDTTLISV